MKYLSLKNIMLDKSVQKVSIMYFGLSIISYVLLSLLLKFLPYDINIFFILGIMIFIEYFILNNVFKFINSNNNSVKFFDYLKDSLVISTKLYLKSIIIPFIVAVLIYIMYGLIIFMIADSTGEVRIEGIYKDIFYILSVCISSFFYYIILSISYINLEVFDNLYNKNNLDEREIIKKNKVDFNLSKKIILTFFVIKIVLKISVILLYEDISFYSYIDDILNFIIYYIIFLSFVYIKKYGEVNYEF